jgi:hypothetical protein
MIQEIWSCGEPGADRGALEAAHRCGVRTGGWSRRDYRIEETDGHKLAEQFALKEAARRGAGVALRLNVKNSDGTLWIDGPADVSTVRYWAAVKAALTYGSPFLRLPFAASPQEAARDVSAWAARWHITTLHVAGPYATLWSDGAARAQAVVAAILEFEGSCHAATAALGNRPRHASDGLDMR